MSTLVTRSGKGSPLTHNEVDANFTNLNTDKVEKTAADITGGTIDNTTIGATTPSTGVFTTLTATGQTSLGGAADAEALRAVTTASAINWVQVSGATNGNAPSVLATGANTSVFLDLASKGTAGGIRFKTAVSTEQMRVSHTASAVNYHQLTGSATGSGPIHSVAGSDTNIDLNLTTKGTGSHVLNTGGGTQFKVLDLTSATTSINARGGVNGGNAQFGLVGTGNTDFIQYTLGTGAFRFLTNGIGSDQMRITHTASAVNYVQVTGAATGNFPVIYGNGSDTNISTAISTKGFSSFIFFTVSGTTNFRSFAVSTSGASDGGTYLQVKGNPAGTAPVLSAQGNDTNIPLVVQPKGTGALQAQQTDSTATGGNARGANAVDWQTLRNGAGQVASGQNSFIGGGGYSTAAGAYSSVVTGFSNTANATVACVLSGQSNVVVGNYAVIAGGVSNAASGWLNFIGGGFTNSGTANAAVTTQSATMNGTTAVTLSGSNASIKVGQYITGTSIAADTYVAAVSGTSLTLSKVASGSSTSTLSFFTPHGVVVGGGNNQATGAYSFIGGGGDAGTAANRNVASGDWGTIAGGRNNTASGVASFVGGGGFTGVDAGGNTASGTCATVSGGFGNTASGTGSSVTGGFQNTANSTVSIAVGGRRGTTRSIIGNTVFSGSENPIADSQGVSQAALLVLARQTTDATATVLTSNASAAGTTNQVILPNNSAYYFKVEIIANVTGGGNTSGWELKGVIKRGANAASTTIVGSVTSTLIAQDAGASTWAVSATADTTNGGLKITCTGQASTTIRWVAKASTTEVTF